MTTDSCRPPSIRPDSGVPGRLAVRAARALTWWRLILVGAAALWLAACATNLGGSDSSTEGLGAGPPTAPAGNGRPRKPVRIGMLLPLSGFGPQAATARGMKQGGELALFELDTPLVQLIVKDDGGTAQGAAQAATDAIGEGAEILVGPLTAEATVAVAPVARQANVPVLSFSNDRRAAGPGVYLMSVLPEQEVERIVAYAAARGKRRFAALLPDDGYGQVIEPALHRAAQRHGGSVAAVTRYPLTANAMLEPVRMLADGLRQSTDTVAPVDTLLVAGGAEVLPQIDPILTYSGVRGDTVQFIGTGGWDYPNAGRAQAFVGGWYPGPDPHGWRDYVQRFSRTFGQPPPRLSSLAYDAVSIAITLSSAEPGQRFTTETLTRPAGFTGIDGHLRFRADGLSERAIAVLELQTFGGHVLDPAQSVPPPDGR
ncbi:penicillin-binding protein activator [Hyphomicrobium nitrativorans]|uniref:penicillin-binding protein activator n=1 Tax=Hyphomicrobium nitrativorans TaxID=1427356 RepID=UPI001182684C|nr:penicillin-binding protein activator [Hyphomicrobium nitrativorans]